MSRFIESICCQDGKALRLDLHQERVNRTFNEYFSGRQILSLQGILKDAPLEGKYKSRIVYDGNDAQVEYQPYETPSIISLKLVEDNEIDYSFKFEDRQTLSQLYKEKGNSSDMLVVKHGLITDTYFANVACFDGSTWMTPRVPLLKGTMREYLLQNRKIIPFDIRVSDLKSFQKISLINAMNDLGNIEIKMHEVK